MTAAQGGEDSNPLRQVLEACVCPIRLSSHPRYQVSYGDENMENAMTFASFETFYLANKGNRHPFDPMINNTPWG